MTLYRFFTIMWFFFILAGGITQKIGYFLHFTNLKKLFGYFTQFVNSVIPHQFKFAYLPSSRWLCDQSRIWAVNGDAPLSGGRSTGLYCTGIYIVIFWHPNCFLGRKMRPVSTGGRVESIQSDLEVEHDRDENRNQLQLLMYIVGGREVGQVTVFKRPISMWKLDLTRTF